MSKRFEIVSFEQLEKEFPREKRNQYESGFVNFTGYAVVLRDNQTGMMYLETKSGLTPLLDRDGKPMTTTYQVSI